ncbi:MAG: S1 RNA-binding domain-containing protein [Patescibacteria group bacterium]|jgi:ribosomal protein S1
MNDVQENSDFQTLLDENPIKVPKVGDTVTGTVVSASKAEVKLDIDGFMTGVVRGRELYNEAEEYSSLKPGDTTEATVTEEENENGELELSFRHAGEEKAWQVLRGAYEDRSNIKVKIVAANKGGLLSNFRQIAGFLPVSQLSPENYPRVEGGDKSKILDKLRTFAGREFEVKVITLDEKENKIIFSEKDAWLERRKDIIGQYQIGSMIDGIITAVTDFGVFIKFGDNLEGLIHISELAWQRIENPSSLYKVGDTIKAEIISMTGSKIFLSAKKLMENPWEEAGERYKVEQVVKGKILKINPFGLFVALDADIHGLAHINQLGLAPNQKINEAYKEGEEREFTIISLEPKEHRLGLTVKKEEDPHSAEATRGKKAKADETKASAQEAGEKTEEPKKVKKTPKAKAEVDKAEVEKTEASPVDAAEEKPAKKAKAKKPSSAKATEDKEAKKEKE